MQSKLILMKHKLFYLLFIVASLYAATLSAQKETSKYDNGKLEYSIEYDADGLEHGQWKFYFENGQVEMMENYNHGLPVGAWESYYENGQLESKSFYNNQGYETGIWEGYFENGKLNYKGEYLNGLPVKEWKIFQENGSLEASLSFNDKGKPTGELIANYKNQKPRVIGYYDENGLKTGTWKLFYSTGTLKAEIVYVNNEITAINSAVDDEGTPLVFTKVVDGPLQGKWIDQEDDGIDEVEYKGVMHVINFGK